jgi:hypothetical protein
VPCLRPVNDQTSTLSVKGDSLQQYAERMLSIESVARRIEAEEQIKALMASEGYVDPAEVQAKVESAAEERRKAHEIISAQALQTAQAIHSGALDEVYISPLGAVKSRPIRRAQTEAAEAREHASRLEARKQRERDQARAEETAEAARQSGPGIGSMRGKRVNS